MYIHIIHSTTCEFVAPKTHIAKHMAINMVYKISKYCAQALNGFSKARRS
jgi:hypothetical protein